jgi:hypothetical protein
MKVLFIIGVLLCSFAFWASVTFALRYMYPTLSGIFLTLLFTIGYLGTAMIGISVIEGHDKSKD